MEFAKEWFQKEVLKKIVILAVFALLFYLLRDMLDLFLLTFLFIYIVHSLQSFFVRIIRRFLPVREVFITIGLYLLLAGLIFLIAYRYIPVVINQATAISNEITEFVDKGRELDYGSAQKRVEALIAAVSKKVNVEDYAKSGALALVNLATNIGKLGINIFIALILTIFFMLEKEKVADFIKKFRSSRVSFAYNEIQYFGRKFLDSFGKVIQAQILIALINSILSVIVLWFLGFPQLLGLGTMIFILTMVPVAGTIISLIPLSIIAFTIGGFTKVLYVVGMILGLHVLESYILDPKLMSSKTNLPIFVVFIILLISEHLMGIWGLIIGIPIFMFILDVLNVNTAD